MFICIHCFSGSYWRMQFMKMIKTMKRKKCENQETNIQYRKNAQQLFPGTHTKKKFHDNIYLTGLEHKHFKWQAEDRVHHVQEKKWN